MAHVPYNVGVLERRVGLKLPGIAQMTALAVAMALVGVTSTPSSARAQDPVVETGSGISAVPKGTIGMGLIGAELGFAIPALAGLDDWYWYVIFPTIGAAGGAVAGWFVADKPGRQNASVALLATGIALILPTMVLTAWKTSYSPDEHETVVEAERVADAEARERLRDAERRRRAGAGMIRRSDDGWLLGAPGVVMAAGQTPKEQILLGLVPAPEVHLALLTGVF
jgi:hypothetical protein